MNTHTCTHAHMHAQTHTHTHIHIHTHAAPPHNHRHTQLPHKKNTGIVGWKRLFMESGAQLDNFNRNSPEDDLLKSY